MFSNNPLIDVIELAQLISRKDLIVVDGSWYLPAHQRNGRQEYNAGHIQGARYFDINEICDQSSDMPHMIPTEQEFANHMEKLGISNSSHVVIYDGIGLFSAARVWWMFRLFGHESVRVLDGGLPAWLETGQEITTDVSTFEQGQYTATLNRDGVKTMSEMQENCKTQQSKVLDARSLARFLGEGAEPRPGLPSGHMPGATSLPFTELMQGNRLKPIELLKQVFAERNIQKDDGITTSCGSGVTAAIITLAMEQCGLGMHSLYDGSWTEWASHSENPIVTDPNS